MGFILTIAVVCVLFYAGTIADGGPRYYSINKCCAENQYFGETFECVDDESKSGKNSKRLMDDLSWFPLDAIVDSKTLKIHEHHREMYGNTMRNKYVVNYGFVPECEDMEHSIFRAERKEWFHFVMDENGGMTVHVSKPSSVHDEKSTILAFERINNDSEAMPVYQNYDSLRALPLEDTCVDAMPSLSSHVLRYCPCRSMLCIMKCCAPNEHFNIEEFRCVENEEIYSEAPFADWRPKTDGEIDKYYLLTDTYPSCDNFFLLKYANTEYKLCQKGMKDSDKEFTIFPNGSIKVNGYRSLYNPDQYCGEVSVAENGSIEEQNLVLCGSGKRDEEEPVRNIMYGVIQVIAGLCLLLTVAVSLYLPSLRRKAHNKIALSHNTSLMCLNFTLAYLQLSEHSNPTLCIGIGITIEFCFLSTFFWLNVMCIDMSLTFSSNKHLQSRKVGGETKKFIYYCIYAYGSTAALCMATIVMEFHPAVDIHHRPGFACVCGFDIFRLTLLIYMFGPMTIILLVNILLFIYTTIRIISIQKQTEVLHKCDSNKTGGSSFKSDKQRYDLIQWVILYGKLCLLMGITWIMETVSLAIGGPSYYWYFSDVLNLFRGVFIFVLFVCKEQVLRSIKKKLNGDSQTISERTVSAKSNTEETGYSMTAQENRARGSIISFKSKGSIKSESDYPKSARIKPNSNPSPIKESEM